MPGRLNGLRAGKYVVRAASIFVELLILIIVAGPIAGALSAGVGAHSSLGLGVDLQAIQPQLEGIFNGGQSIAGTHQVSVPAFNNWPLAGKVSLTLSITDGNQTLYQTQPATALLAPFQSGVLNVSMTFSPGLVSEMQGQRLSVGGSESISEAQLWTITVNLAKP